MSDIFISYASEDRPRVVQLAQALVRQGWSVFWDRTIPPGKTWREFIGKELDDAQCIVVTWSKVSTISHWVCEEADEGNRRRILVPAFIETVRPPFGFRSLQAADLSQWDGSPTDAEFCAFVVGIAGVLGPPPAEAETRRQTEREERKRAEAEAKRKAEDEESPAPVDGTEKSLRGIVLSELRRFEPEDGIFLSPDIPQKKFQAAQKSCGLAPDTEVYALIDFTVFGGAKDALIVSENGIAYNHCGATPQRQDFSFEEISTSKIQPKGIWGILVGEKEISISGGPARKTIIDFLETVVRIAKVYLLTENKRGTES